MENQLDRLVVTIVRRFKAQGNCAERVVRLSESEVILSTSIGNDRKRNEDRIVFATIQNQAFSRTSLAIGALADGMGGMEMGDDAASITLAGFISYLALGASERGLKELCRRAIEYAHRKTIDVLGKKCGSTLSAIVYGKNGYVGINVGDSRIYSYDKFEGAKQLTVDDTIAAQVHGAADGDDNWSNPHGGDNRLIQHIGMEGELEPHIIGMPIVYGANQGKSGYLLTSDGLHYIGKKMLTQIIMNSASGSDLSKRITSVAECLSGHDNLSLVVLPQFINLPEITFEDNSTAVNICTPDAEFEVILQKAEYLKQNNRTFKSYQKKLFSENIDSLRSEDKISSDKNDSNIEKSTEAKKKAPAKKAPKKTTSKKTAFNKKGKNKGKIKSSQIDKEKEIEAKIDYINGDDESGAKNEI